MPGVQGDRGNQASSYPSHNILAVCLPPFVAARRLTQLVLTVVNDLSALLFVVAYAMGTPPSMATTVILAPGFMGDGLAAIALALTWAIAIGLGSRNRAG